MIFNRTLQLLLRGCHRIREYVSGLLCAFVSICKTIKGQSSLLWPFFRSSALTPVSYPVTANMNMEQARKALGIAGETLALRYLKKQGYKLLRQNYRAGGMEVDLICRDGSSIVFVEVKTRRSENFRTPESSVNKKKQEHIAAAAKIFIKTNRLQQYTHRFEIVAIIWPEGSKPVIRQQQIDTSKPRKKKVRKYYY